MRILYIGFVVLVTIQGVAGLLTAPSLSFKGVIVFSPLSPCRCCRHNRSPRILSKVKKAKLNNDEHDGEAVSMNDVSYDEEIKGEEETSFDSRIVSKTTTTTTATATTSSQPEPPTLQRNRVTSSTKPQREEETSRLSFQERVDEFLDRPFFYPDEYDDNDETDKSILAKFARLVKSDYELAETLYVGIMFVVLVILSQELLRMQLYGDAYIPFASRGGAITGSGRLF